MERRALERSSRARRAATAAVIRGERSCTNPSRAPLTSCAKARIIAARLSRLPQARRRPCLPSSRQSPPKRPKTRNNRFSPATRCLQPASICPGAPRILFGRFSKCRREALGPIGVSRPLECWVEWHPHASSVLEGDFALPTLQLLTHAPHCSRPARRARRRRRNMTRQPSGALVHFSLHLVVL